MLREGVLLKRNNSSFPACRVAWKSNNEYEEKNITLVKLLLSDKGSKQSA